MQKEAELPLPLPLSEWAERQAIALFLDFDGTLVEIADKPDGIHVPGSLPTALERLNARVDQRLALVTGRALGDLRRYLGDVAITLVGSHGAEFGSSALDALDLSSASADALAAIVAQWPSLLVETKPHGVAVHYRQEPEAQSAVYTVMADIAQREGLALKRGKMVAELGSPLANKGKAVARLMELAPYAGALPIFIGDDVTDEDGFAAVAALGGHGILVGPQRATAAHYRLGSTQEVHAWLNL